MKAVSNLWRGYHEYVLSGLPLWNSHAAQEPRLYAGGAGRIGARNRREYGPLQRGIWCIAKAAALRPRQRIGGAATGLPQGECDQCWVFSQGIEGLSRAGKVAGAD